MISFDQNGITGVSTFQQNSYTGSACHSNKKGELVITTNGNAVYDGTGTPLGSITSGPADNGTSDAVIIPLNEEETRFYIFTVTFDGEVRYALADVVTQELIVSPNILLSNSCSNITAVKHCFLDAFWLICSDRSNNFYSYLVKENSISKPVVSTLGGNRIGTGDMVASFQGDKLAVSSYVISQFNEHWIETYDFDKQCGNITNVVRLGKLNDNDDFPHGLCFAPDGRSLYAAWSYGKSNLVQYILNGPSQIYNCYSSQDNINDVEIGPDGQMYLNVHKDGTPSRRIHVLKFPNSFGGGSRVTEDVATLPVGTNGAFEFPNFIHCWSKGCDNKQIDDVLISVSDNRCTDRKVRFDISGVQGICDSLRWDFDDPGSPDNSSTSYTVERYFSEQRTYTVKCYIYFCDIVDTVRTEITMREKPVLNLGNDTTICADASISIGFEQNFDSIVWNDGSHAPFRIARPGKYSATAYNGACITTDEIIISAYPDIWTALEAEYFICDIENEAVKLDAGPGFKRYQWIPTGETSQWIIVEQIGEYMVIVDAFTGCTGDGSTVVRRVCDLTYHIPNAFSPNNDNHNDVFRVNGEFIERQTISIFNRWGERIHYTEGANSYWDGQDSPVGAYFYQVEIEGFLNKRPVTIRKNGIVHLIR